MFFFSKATTETDSLQRHNERNSTDRQSFLHICSMTDDDATLYFLCTQLKRTRLLAYQDHLLSAYHLSIFPPLIINNLLPCNLFFQLYPNAQKFRIDPYQSYSEYKLDISRAIDILFNTDLYHMRKPLHVPSLNDLNIKKYYRQKVAFYDSIERLLLVNITIVCSVRYHLKISISVPYILLNKTGMNYFYEFIFKSIKLYY